MKELPILFSTPMVQAILAGRKTVTRRTIKNQPPHGFERHCWFHAPLYGFTPDPAPSDNWHMVKCPYGKHGDVLWVRETWAPAWNQVLYKANERYGKYEGQKWKPSIHMPKGAARIWLQVTDVRVERLQDISEEDAIAEGIEEIGINPSDLKPEYKDYKGELFRIGESKPWGLSPIGSFNSLCDKINGTESWQSNPWVWVVSFKVLSTTGKPDLQTLKSKA